MRKWIFSILLVAALVGLAFAGEGDRKYSNFYSAQALTGAQKTIILPWTAWKYTLVINHGVTLVESVRVHLTFSDGDTALIRFPGALTATPTNVIPFYGPPVCTLRIKCYGANNSVTVLAWK